MEQKRRQATRLPGMATVTSTAGIYYRVHTWFVSGIDLNHTTCHGVVACSALLQDSGVDWFALRLTPDNHQVGIIRTSGMTVLLIFKIDGFAHLIVDGSEACVFGGK